MSKQGFLFVDWGLLLPVVAILIVSLTTLFSINPDFFRSQLIFIVISFAMYFFFSQMSFKLIQFHSLAIYITAIILFAIILVLGIESRGAVRWVDIFGIRIQFSEIMKPFLLVSLAGFLSRRTPSFRTLVTSFLYILPLTFLVIIQPDLGNGMIYLLVVGFTFLVYGFPFSWFVAGFVGFIASLPIFWKFLYEYQRQRILTFFSPSKDPLGTSYNVIQSIIAVGSGMTFGKGIGEATQSKLRFLPERHTDFIFATLSEGLGIVGSYLIVVCFFVLLYKIYVVAQRAKDPFPKLFAAGAFFLILIQFFVNIGMNIGIIPIAGVTLPFISYGGSSLLSNFILLGFLSSISRSLRQKEVLEIG